MSWSNKVMLTHKKPCPTLISWTNRPKRGDACKEESIWGQKWCRNRMDKSKKTWRQIQSQFFECGLTLFTRKSLTFDFNKSGGQCTVLVWRCAMWFHFIFLLVTQATGATNITAKCVGCNADWQCEMNESKWGRVSRRAEDICKLKFFLAFNDIWIMIAQEKSFQTGSEDIDGQKRSPEIKWKPKTCVSKMKLRECLSRSVCAQTIKVRTSKSKGQLQLKRMQWMSPMERKGHLLFKKDQK